MFKKIFRTDYQGQNIKKIEDDITFDYFIEPRENVFKRPNTDSAIILGNGPTKNHRQVQQLLLINSNKVSESYKLVYACNRAVTDQMIYDYYILKHKVFLGEVREKKSNLLPQVYLPYDIFLDYKDECNLLPLYVTKLDPCNVLPNISYFDSGTSAAYLSCFDGHKKVFLLGFDGDIGFGWQTIYDGEFPYNNNKADMSKWEDSLLTVMSTYTETTFYRLQLDGQSPPNSWLDLPNFQNLSFREFVLAGDF